jgi:hypothetical protein
MPCSQVVVVSWIVDANNNNITGIVGSGQRWLTENFNNLLVDLQSFA